MSCTNYEWSLQTRKLWASTMESIGVGLHIPTVGAPGEWFLSEGTIWSWQQPDIHFFVSDEDQHLAGGNFFSDIMDISFVQCRWLFLAYLDYSDLVCFFVLQVWIAHQWKTGTVVLLDNYFFNFFFLTELRGGLGCKGDCQCGTTPRLCEM